jgi:hypothetical protein
MSNLICKSDLILPVFARCFCALFLHVVVTKINGIVKIVGAVGLMVDGIKNINFFT